MDVLDRADKMDAVVDYHAESGRVVTSWTWRRGPSRTGCSRSS